MVVRVWRLVTILFIALSLTPALGHLLELPAKMTYDAALWLTVSQTLYGAFGTIGGFFEVGAVVTAVVLTILVRHRHPAFGWTLLGALCVAAAHAAFWIWLAPVNATVAGLTLETLPTDWMDLRNRWEYTHAARAVLQFIALAALTFSVLIEIPADDFRKRPDRGCASSG